MVSNEELTRIYNEANGIEGKSLPITTERIFAVMRLAMREGMMKAAEICDREWNQLKEIEAAHYRNSPTPFQPHQFVNVLSVMRFHDKAEEIRLSVERNEQ